MRTAEQNGCAFVSISIGNIKTNTRIINATIMSAKIKNCAKASGIFREFTMIFRLDSRSLGI